METVYTIGNSNSADLIHDVYVYIRKNKFSCANRKKIVFQLSYTTKPSGTGDQDSGK